MDPQEFLPFIDSAFDGMLAIADGLGDERVNARPGVEGANSAFALITHCIGVTDWWVGLMIAGRSVDRDRDAEFVAAGTVAELREAVAALRERLVRDLDTMIPGAPIRHPERLPEGSVARSWTQDAALIHTLEELAQHHGQLEIGRDILAAR